ncbi:hypothetical protein [Mycoplasma mycoides]|uniref:hypothetical protein n=1 Tax=Mycoplasma mycoides TaxID=2102 RepID=UPI002240399A|nr:hypothetical protein [Mycoplasma mycoides]QVK06428.1 hypothetical protein I7642_02375 [Mycoplasma mycoides subsp. capri]
MNSTITKQNKRLDDLYKAGLILIIIGCSFTLLWAVISFFGLIVGGIAISATSNYYPNYNDHVSGAGIAAALTGINIIIIIASLPALITLLFAIKSLKYQTYKYKIICGIMGIVFGLLFGIIGGIFLLVSSKKDEDDPYIIIKDKMNNKDNITSK